MHKRTVEVERALSHSGYRITLPRRAVIEVVTRARRSLSPQEVLERARKINPSVGLATVYRTLDVLHEQGHLKRVHIGKARYALPCTEAGLHFHLVCQKCRGVIELPPDRHSRRLADQLLAAGFEAHTTAVEIIGLCARCRPAE